jgi:hypothetical protein
MFDDILKNRNNLIIISILFAACVYYFYFYKNNDRKLDYADNTEAEAESESESNYEQPVNQQVAPQEEQQLQQLEEQIDRQLEQEQVFSNQNTVAASELDNNVEQNDLQDDVYGAGNEAGADFADAFKRPISATCTPDKVDFNRNNVQQFKTSDYLPKEVNDEWFDTDFQQAKHKVDDDSLINANRYVIGINTVGQSLKNPSYDLRGTIANPKYNVGPWANSTYEPDFNLKSLN